MNARLLLVAPLMAAVAMPARGAPADIDRPQLEAAITYALPLAFEGFAATCRARLAPDGFLAKNRARLEQRFNSAAEGSWPRARDVLLQIGRKQTDEGGAVDALASLPEESLRPFVDGIVSAMIVKEIKPANCGDIEEILRLLDPLPVSNLVEITGFAFEMMERDKAAESQSGKTK